MNILGNFARQLELVAEIDRKNEPLVGLLRDQLLDLQRVPSKDLVQINLMDLETDPFASLRNNPMELIAVIETIVTDQLEETKISATDFKKSIPIPPDPMFDALRDAILEMFSKDRQPHVKEVLAGHAEMAVKTDKLALDQMNFVLNDPQALSRIKKQADADVKAALDELFTE
jgi:hypothetical protein